jgi:hypothetical protein
MWPAEERAPVFSDSQKLGFEPRWSSDNQWITYLSPDFVGIGVYNLETGAEQFYPTQAGKLPLAARPNPIFNERTARPSANVVRFTSFSVDPVADTRTNLSGEEALVEDGAAVWSPDGQRIAFRRNITSRSRSHFEQTALGDASDGSAARRADLRPGGRPWPARLVFGRAFVGLSSFPAQRACIDRFHSRSGRSTSPAGCSRPIRAPGERPQWLR